ncbi:MULTISPECIES: hypothetical protein [unclassified Agrococcus]|uniref:hypothetical protein n=1 Tax=unclassified Agrococcus TaxID=2615065 RepID=UPI0036103059
MSSSSRTAHGARLDRRRRALAHAAILTGLTTAVTGCAHSLAGGSAPSLLLLGVASMVTLVLLAPVLGARAPWHRRVVAIAAAQVLQHGLYSLPQPTASPVQGHAHHGAEALPTIASGAASHAHGDMLLAHVLAGALALAASYAGAAVVAAVLGAVRGDRLVRVVALVVPLGVTGPAAVTAARPVVRSAQAVLRTPAVRRGPPLLAV